MDVGEAMAARQGMKVVREVEFYNFVLETYSMLLFEALRRKKKLCSSFGLILSDIYMLIAQFVNVSFRFIRRIGNQVAHLLARRSLDKDELFVWLDEDLIHCR